MHRRRAATIATAFAMLVSACGGEAAEDGSASPATESAEPAATETTEPDDETEPEPEPEAEATSEPEDGSGDVPEADAAVAYPVTVTDAVGAEYTIDGPARLGCVTLVCREILAGLGVPPAASTYDEQPFYFPVGPPEFVVTDNNDLEAWSGATIDFAVFGGPRIAYHDTVEDVVPVFFVHTPGRTAPELAGFEAVYESTRTVAVLVDRVAEGERLIADLESAIATARSFSTPELADRSFVNLFNGQAYLMEIGNADAVGSWAFCSVILAAELGYCAEVDISAQEINAEAFLELDPDIVALQAGSLTVATRDDPVWGRISAVENGLAYDSAHNGYRFGNIRSLIWALQEYVHFTIPDSGIGHPGPLSDFVPAESPLVP